MPRCDEALHVGVAGHARHRITLPPVGATILRNLNETIVRPDKQQPFLALRLGDRTDVAVECSGLILGDRVGAPQLSHHGHGVAIDLSREVAADGLPAVAAIVAAIEALRCGVQSRM